ncbi:hypothetical protein D049_2411A, partial [Vibrio parahaemolyticus VPTS-2010]
MPRLSQTGRAI